jgi:hypothetical protein
VSRQRLTACLIVQDEQARLPGALASVAFCDEIVVVDGGSRDRTAQVAREAGARVIENPWPGFAAQRNLALDAAGGDWVLEIDADERISPTLRASIEGLLADPPVDADIAVFALRNRFLGGGLGPSAKYPAYRSRLFRRGAYRHDEGRAVHEGIEPRERPLVLEGDLEHELAGTLGEALADTWRYARLESVHIARPSSPLPYLKGMLLRPSAKFAYRTLVDGGWRDGWRGLLKIALDVSSDALVWALVLSGRGGRVAEAAGDPDGRGGAGDDDARTGDHFGRRRVGAPKVVAVAARGRPTQAAIGRLRELRERGVDVAVISEEPPGDCELPAQRVARLAPIAVIRALELEMHVRAIDTVLPVGARARIVVGMLPASLRPREVDPDAPVKAA